MDKCCSTAVGLYKVQHTKSLTLCWRSFSAWGCDHVAITFAQNSCQYDDYGYLPYQSPWIIQDAKPKIVDTLLTLCWHSVDAVMMLCWRFVDALLMLCWRSFGGVAVSTHTILPVKPANNSIMDKCHSTAFGLHKMEPTKSSTLCWRSFSDWGSDHIVIAWIQNGCQYGDYGYIP
jgi:hypothetical protein